MSVELLTTLATKFVGVDAGVGVGFDDREEYTFGEFTRWVYHLCANNPDANPTPPATRTGDMLRSVVRRVVRGDTLNAFLTLFFGGDSVYFELFIYIQKKTMDRFVKNERVL
jgi:hypothetical protein